MSGDIDIEEHDLMENPKIRTIFPDLTLLKKEILDPYHEELTQRDGNLTNEIHQLSNFTLCQGNQNVANDSITNVKHKIKLEENSTDDQTDLRLGGAKISKSEPLFSNKIILGSKPPGAGRDKKLDLEVKIFLKNINNYLFKSERYCMICKTLFSRKHLLQHHTSVNHRKDKSNKPLDMHRNNSVTNSQVSKKDSIVTENKGNSMNKCFHCNVSYPSQELLIDHLYDVLEKKRAGISENVSANSKSRDRIPKDSSKSLKIMSKVNKDCKTISKDHSVSNIKSKDNEGCKTKPVEHKTCERKRVDDEECETILVDAKDCVTMSVDAKDCEIISIDDEYSESKFDEIEILCDISRDEVLQCAICSYYFQQQKFYDMHMIKKHDIKIKKNNIVKFNPKCKYCSGVYPGIKQYNAHLHKRHSTMIFNVVPNSTVTSTQTDKMNQKYENENINQLKQMNIENQSKIATPVTQIIEKSKANSDLLAANFMIFKTVLFKCLKCDVHFLSPNLATNHIVHNEMLINWKCPSCKIFFKKNDEEIHSKQHLNTESFTIFHLDATDLSRILIKCTKCDVYIYTDDFTSHLKVCETNIQSWYCSICEIMIDKNILKKHKRAHRNRGNEASDFILIDDSSTTQTEKSTSNDFSTEVDELEKCNTVHIEENEFDDDYSADDLEIIYPITELKVKDQPMRFKNLKRKMKDTKNSKKTFKRLKINDCITEQNIFYSKLNYKTHVQPKLLLNLTYCNFCECFISMYYKLNIHLRKRCVHIQKRVCNICGLTLTAKAIGTHKEFHKLNPGLKLQDFIFYDIDTNERILPPIPIYPKCDNCDTHFINKMEISCHVCNEIQCPRCDICDMKFSEVTLNLHILFHGYYLKSKPSIEKISDVESNIVKENADLDQLNSNEQVGSEQAMQSEHVELEKNEAGVNEHNNNCDEDMVLMYTCESCNVTVSSYDQLIEHCHLHYDNSHRNIKTRVCAECNLIFEHSSITPHKKLHLRGVTKESFKIHIFDVFHFGRSNWEWLNHVFKSLSDDKVKEIIKDSIYRFEYRVKLEVTQQGSPELTLYQCVKCGIFIDGCQIYSHRKMCQGGYKKYPCEYCGIPLLSTALRSDHIKIHDRANISIKSYRIVIFNRVKDKILNDAIATKNNHYVLYQCRICNGVVDWRLLKAHKCNIEVLKKCSDCGLLICNNDYDEHVSRHRALSTFIASNMKVVLFGQTTIENKETNDRACSFNGIVYDYTFYKCIKCDVCIQHLRPCSKHFCLIDEAKWKCSMCDLVFDEGKKKGHRAIHNTDLELTKDTICVIPFDPQETYERLEKELKSRSRTEKDVENSETDIMYKCSCGLHYLTEESAKEHVAKKKCHLYLKKNAKQTCSKCNLVFTSDTLFKHLLKHHGDKNIKYKFDIVNVCEDTDDK